MNQTLTSALFTTLFGHVTRPVGRATYRPLREDGTLSPEDTGDLLLMQGVRVLKPDARHLALLGLPFCTQGWLRLPGRVLSLREYAGSESEHLAARVQTLLRAHPEFKDAWDFSGTPTRHHLPLSLRRALSKMHALTPGVEYLLHYDLRPETSTLRVIDPQGHDRARLPAWEDLEYTARVFSGTSLTLTSDVGEDTLIDAVAYRRAPEYYRDALTHVLTRRHVTYLRLNELLTGQMRPARLRVLLPLAAVKP